MAFCAVIQKRALGPGGPMAMLRKLAIDVSEGSLMRLGAAFWPPCPRTKKSSPPSPAA